MNQVFVSYLPMILPILEVASRKALTAACNEGRNQVLLNLRNIPPRTGRRYKVPMTNAYYTASAPGEYPAMRPQVTQLRGSYRVVVRGGTGYIGTDVDYALALEKKPRDKGGRPHLKPSLDQATKRMLFEMHKRWL